MTALTLTESDTAGSGHANITGAVYGTSADIEGSTSTLPTSTDDNGIFGFEVDLRSRKRYIDLTATVGNGTNGAYLTVISRLSRAKICPGNTLSEKGLTGCVRV